MTIAELIESASREPRCVVLPGVGQPKIPEGVRLPADLSAFYGMCGGIELFHTDNYGIRIVSASEFIRANPVIVGDDCADDISYDWFIIARAHEQYVTIDTNPQRLGRCYDSFWDRHGVPGECPVIAMSFLELFESLLRSRGAYWYWLQNDFQGKGDAYDVNAPVR
jgi:antitoxin YokJ